MNQTEARRQFYLGVAGIRLWYAREPLPGAAPSPEFQFPEPEGLERQPVLGELPVAAVSDSAKATASPSEAGQQGIQQIANLQAMMESKKEPAPTKAERESHSPEPPGQAAEVSEDTVALAPQPRSSVTRALNVSMGVFSGNRHILLAHISKEASLQLQETLATNILKSLGDKSLQQPEWVRWPVFNNRLVPGSALSDLMTVMEQVLAGSGNKKVIVLGSFGEGAEGRGWLADVLQRTPEVEFEYTLAELASNPRLKHALWQHLKPLAAI
ncbi:MAG: hypothetical protein ACTHV7_07045 [Oleiphilaceae bacterium]